MAINTFKSHVRRVIGESLGKIRERKLKHTDLNDPNRQKCYGRTYTERQLRILSGDLPWELVRQTEITIVMNKAKAMDDDENYKQAAMLRELKQNQDLISEILEENYFCFFICLLDRERFSAAGCSYLFICTFWWLQPHNRMQEAHQIAPQGSGHIRLSSLREVA